MTAFSEIQQRIADATAKQDFDEAARLAQIASQLKKLDEQKNHLLAAVQPNSHSQPEQFTRSTQPTLPLAPLSNGSHVQRLTTQSRTSSRGGLTVELTTKGGAPIRICERTSSDTLVVLMERILTHFGMPGLEKLMGLHVSRGPLVSRNPQRDYLNARTGVLYSHHRIPGTDLYVLTHSDNQQKVKDIRSALRMLGLPDGAFRVSLS